jgi:hypothetical protein
MMMAIHGTTKNQTLKADAIAATVLKPTALMAVMVIGRSNDKN